MKVTALSLTALWAACQVFIARPF